MKKKQKKESTKFDKSKEESDSDDGPDFSKSN